MAVSCSLVTLAMGERKVLNKYYPPDINPSQIPRHRQPKNHQIKVRMMLPMSIRCTTCTSYIYQGTKFNSRKEDVGGTYLGMPIFRFYFKCTKCSSEITIKTDPENSDYTVEAGATRNFEPWKSTDEIVEKAKKKRSAEEMGDGMKALENRTLDSKRELDILEMIDEMRSLRARQAEVGTEQMLEALKRTEEMKDEAEELAEEDEALIRSIIFHRSDKFVRRLEDDDEDEGVKPTTRPSSTTRSHHPHKYSSSNHQYNNTNSRPGLSGRASSLLLSTHNPNPNIPVSWTSSSSSTPAHCFPHISLKSKDAPIYLHLVPNSSTPLHPITSSLGLTSLCATYDDDDSSHQD